MITTKDAKGTKGEEEEIRKAGKPEWRQKARGHERQESPRKDTNKEWTQTAGSCGSVPRMAVIHEGRTPAPRWPVTVPGGDPFPEV
jgi:hypothetical protein